MPRPDGRRLVEKAKDLVRLTGEETNRVFAELAEWEQVLKDTSLARPSPPSL